MKTISTAVWVLVSGIAFSALANAHDPSEHAAKGESPDCSAMPDMHQASMNASDPVMQAMMKKCAEAMHGNAKDQKQDQKQDQKHGSAHKDDSGHHQTSGGHDDGDQHGH